MRGIVYEQLFEILDKKSNSFIMLNTLIWAQSKPMIAELNWQIMWINIIYLWLKNNHTRYDSSRDKMDAIGYIIISP